MKGRRAYSIFITLFFAALADLYFWIHVLRGEDRLWCPTGDPKAGGCYSDLEIAITIAIGVLAILVGFAARLIARKKS